MESKLVALSGEPKKQVAEPKNSELETWILSRDTYEKENDLLWGEDYIPITTPRQEILDRVSERLDELKTEGDEYMLIIVASPSYYKSNTDLKI